MNRRSTAKAEQIGLQLGPSKLGYVLTAWQDAARLAFVREHWSWRLHHQCAVLYTDKSRLSTFAGCEKKICLPPATFSSFTVLLWVSDDQGRYILLGCRSPSATQMHPYGCEEFGWVSLAHCQTMSYNPEFSRAPPPRHTTDSLRAVFLSGSCPDAKVDMVWHLFFLSVIGPAGWTESLTHTGYH